MKLPPRKAPSGQPKIDPATHVPEEVEGKNHATAIADIAIMAAKANVKKLVLTHYPPFEMDLEAKVEQFKLYYEGEVISGQDLLEIKQ